MAGAEVQEAVDHPMQDVDAPPSNGVDAFGDNDDTLSDQGSAYDSEDHSEEATLASLQRRGLLPTGVCYDDRMKLHMNADFSPNSYHPEDPRRIHKIFTAFKRNGLIYMGPHTDLPKVLKETPTKYMWRIACREAEREEICLAHDASHVDFVESWNDLSAAQMRELTKQYDQGRESLYIGSMSHQAGLLAAGGAIETCKDVVSGVVKNAFAVIRPPGHHAEIDHPMGFCLFNNVPVAVRVCQRDYPETCRKVLILDWDVHHGNGIQNIFWQDPNVLYISIHVYQNGQFYPGQPPNPHDPDGGLDQCGSGPGRGMNINIGWHDQGMGDGEYMAAFQKIVMPIAHEFDPDLVVISAGFDAADGDELGGCFVTPPCYAHMTHMLMSLANGKVAVCLEGGYNFEAISNSAVAVAKTLMGEPPPKLKIPPINREAARTLAKVQAIQAPFWQCMRAGVVDVLDLQDHNAERLHDVVRTAQLQDLSTKYRMTALYMQHEQLYKSYENQVLVTPNLMHAKRILVVLHDPPGAYAQPDAIDRHLEPHNAWVVDGVREYIDWAVGQNFGVMDVNIPGYVTRDEDSDSFTPALKEEELQEQVRTLVCYLWDNFLQLYAADEIFLMGVGNAYVGVKLLLINRGDSKSRVSGIVSFVNGNLRPVKSETDPDLSSWYKDNSQIYVSAEHACWSNPDLLRKINKRRFGTVVRSDKAALNAMMKSHASEAQAWMLERVEESSHGETTEDEEDDDEDGKGS